MTIPKMIAECCTELGTKALIQMSSVAASPDSDSKWAKTKWEGEQVRECPCMPRRGFHR